MNTHNYAQFGQAVCEMLKRHELWFSDEWSEDIMPLAVAAGLAARVEYDPESAHAGLHVENAEPGDEIWIWL